MGRLLVRKIVSRAPPGEAVEGGSLRRNLPSQCIQFTLLPEHDLVQLFDESLLKRQPLLERQEPGVGGWAGIGAHRAWLASIVGPVAAAAGGG